MGENIRLKIEEVRRMTRLDCAIRLLRCLRSFDNCDSRDVEAFARAIIELGRNEMKELARSEKM